MMPIASPPRGLRRLIAATVVLSVATTLGPSLAAAVTACPGGNVTLATINGSSDPIGVDDDLQVQLNGSVIFENNDEIATNLPPIPFTAAYGDVLRIIASNSTVYGGHAYVASLVVYCDANGASQVLQSTPVEYATWPTGAVFFDYEYTLEFSNPTFTYAFGGFLAPVDNLPALNSVAAGSAVPVKFSLGGDEGLAIFASGYPRSQGTPCNSTADVDAIEETVTAGGSSLSYNSLTDTYTYVWKTEKVWKGTCRQLVVALADGTYHRANFMFK